MRISSKERDRETGLSDHGARLYDAQVAVWMSPDVKRQFNNRYSYGNDPINGIDLDGKLRVRAWKQLVNEKKYDSEKGFYIIKSYDIKYTLESDPDAVKKLGNESIAKSVEIGMEALKMATFWDKTVAFYDWLKESLFGNGADVASPKANLIDRNNIDAVANEKLKEHFKYLGNSKAMNESDAAELLNQVRNDPLIGEAMKSNDEIFEDANENQEEIFIGIMEK